MATPGGIRGTSSRPILIELFVVSVAKGIIITKGIATATSVIQTRRNHDIPMKSV
jgi:hypothetical protein